MAHTTEWLRPGIMLYGVSPFLKSIGFDYGLQPVMTLQSQIIAIRRVGPGEEVGYGGTWTAEEPSLIAVVGIGYGDGYPRHIAENTPVLIHNQRCPIVGRVSMDMLTVDITHIAQSVALGDSVTLWGKGLPAEQIAAQANTIAYELLSQVTHRVKKIYGYHPYTAEDK
jgi:alanine racemase